MDTKQTPSVDRINACLAACEGVEDPGAGELNRYRSELWKLRHQDKKREHKEAAWACHKYKLEIKQLRADIKTNAAMLARQTDLAREAETQALALAHELAASRAFWETEKAELVEALEMALQGEEAECEDTELTMGISGEGYEATCLTRGEPVPCNGCKINAALAKAKGGEIGNEHPKCDSCRHNIMFHPDMDACAYACLRPHELGITPDWCPIRSKEAKAKGGEG